MAIRIRKSTPSDTNIFLFFLDRTSHPPCCQFYLIAGLYHTAREMSYCILLIQVLMKQTLLPTPGFTPVWVSVWISPSRLRKTPSKSSENKKIPLISCEISGVLHYRSMIDTKAISDSIGNLRQHRTNWQERLTIYAVLP